MQISSVQQIILSLALLQQLCLLIIAGNSASTATTAAASLVINSKTKTSVVAPRRKKAFALKSQHINDVIDSRGSESTNRVDEIDKNQSIVVTTTEKESEISSKSQDRPQFVLDALRRKESIYYFGLGSNMLRSKVENRSMDGKIEIENMEPAVVPNHRLAFNMRGFPPIEPGMGSLEPIEQISTADVSSKLDDNNNNNHNNGALLSYEKNECHGALIKLSPENYEKVMRSEGVGIVNSTNPPGYEEVIVTAIPYDKERGPVLAVALRAREHVRLPFDPCPSVRYMNILKQGAKELNLKPCYQTFLENHPVQIVPSWLRKVAMYNLITTMTVSMTLKWRGLSKLQSWLLFRVYVPSNVSTQLKTLSDIAMSIILMPGAVVGWPILLLLRKTNIIQMPPFFERMISMFDESATNSSASTTSNTDKTTAAAKN